MKLIEIKCPNCGADLHVSPKAKSAKCEYCNHDFVIDDEIIKVEHYLKDAEQAGYEFEKGRQRAIQETLAAEEQSDTIDSSGSNNASVEECEEKGGFSIFPYVMGILCVVLVYVTFFSSDEGNKKSAETVPAVQVTIPNDGLQKLFMELKFETTMSDVEKLAKKYNMKISKAEYNGSLNYKIGATEEAASFARGSNGDYIEFVFDSRNDFAFMFAQYHKRDKYSSAILFQYGSYFDLRSNKIDEGKKGYYYYNADLAGKMNEKDPHPPYERCYSAKEALTRIYTFKKK